MECELSAGNNFDRTRVLIDTPSDAESMALSVIHVFMASGSIVLGCRHVFPGQSETTTLSFVKITATRVNALTWIGLKYQLTSRGTAMKRLLITPILFSMIAGILTVSGAPAQAATTDVGVVPASRSCPIGVEGIVIRMDDEDGNNGNNRSGNIGAIQSDSNTSFFFCRVNGASLRALQPPGSTVRPYAVLKLGATCPNGSQQFSRRFDNEDDNNGNFFEGNIFPNTSDDNTILVFCLFAPGLSTMTTFPNFGFRYLTFSSVDSSGFLRTDDEDDNNGNQYTVPAGVASIAKAIVSDGANTIMRLRVAR